MNEVSGSLSAKSVGSVGSHNWLKGLKCFCVLPLFLDSGSLLAFLSSLREPNAYLQGEYVAASRAHTSLIAFNSKKSNDIFANKSQRTVLEGYQQYVPLD